LVASEKKGSGRKRTITKEIKDKIINQLKTTIYSINDIRLNLEKYQIKVSNSTVRTIMIDNGLRYKYPKPKPSLTDEQKKNRLSWAKKYKKIN